MVISRLLAAALLVSMLSGCAYGIIYTSSAEPLTTNMRATPRGISKGEAGTRMVSLPLSAANLSVGWRGRAIADAARQASLSEIYYADLHTESILLGLWEEKIVRVYGK